jgi:hypothetical protein
MKKLVISAFSIFYLAFTLALTAESTLSLASAFNLSCKSHAHGMRLHSPRAPQKRALEQPFEVAPVYTASPLAVVAADAYLPSPEQLANSIDSPVPPRAPPALV